MFAKLQRSFMVVSFVVLTLGACGSHVGDAPNALTPAGAVVRDPDNPYWQARPLNFDSVDPAQGLGMR